ENKTGIAQVVEGGRAQEGGVERPAARGGRGGACQHRFLPVAAQEDAFPEEGRGIVGCPQVIAIHDITLIVDGVGLEVIDAESGSRWKRNLGPKRSQDLETQEVTVF